MFVLFFPFSLVFLFKFSSFRHREPAVTNSQTGHVVRLQDVETTFEFGVNGKFVVRYFLFRTKIIALSRGFAMWHGTNTMVRLLNFNKTKNVKVRRRGLLKSAKNQTRQVFVVVYVAMTALLFSRIYGI